LFDKSAYSNKLQDELWSKDVFQYVDAIEKITIYYYW
jgi:hypothetical protein